MAQEDQETYIRLRFLELWARWKDDVNYSACNYVGRNRIKTEGKTGHTLELVSEYPGLVATIRNEAVEHGFEVREVEVLGEQKLVITDPLIDDFYRKYYPADHHPRRAAKIVHQCLRVLLEAGCAKITITGFCDQTQDQKAQIIAIFEALNTGRHHTQAEWYKNDGVGFMNNDRTFYKVAWKANNPNELELYRIGIMGPVVQIMYGALVHCFAEDESIHTLEISEHIRARSEAFVAEEETRLQANWAESWARWKANANVEIYKFPVDAQNPAIDAILQEVETREDLYESWRPSEGRYRVIRKVGAATYRRNESLPAIITAADVVRGSIRTTAMVDILLAILNSGGCDRIKIENLTPAQPKKVGKNAANTIAQKVAKRVAKIVAKKSMENAAEKLDLALRMAKFANTDGRLYGISWHLVNEGDNTAILLESFRGKRLQISIAYQNLAAPQLFQK